MARRTATLALAALATLVLGACSASRSTSNSGPLTSGHSASNTLAKQSAPGDPARGRTIFLQNCAMCHGAAATGGVGPALKNEKSRKNFAQAVAWIKHPQPPMPKLYPSPLSEKDVRDVAAYVESL